MQKEKEFDKAMERLCKLKAEGVSPLRVPSAKSPPGQGTPPMKRVVPLVVSTEVQTNRRRVTIDAESVASGRCSASAKKRNATAAPPSTESTATFVHRGLTNALKDMFTTVSTVPEAVVHH